MAKPKSIYIYGSYAEEYSLAIVNRGLAIALHKLGIEAGIKVRIGGYSKDIARQANAQDLKRNPELKELIADPDSEEWDILIYNNFPKDANAKHGLASLPGKVKGMYTAWEEDLYPERWVNEINQNLKFVFVPSEHVRWVLSRSGVTLPIIVIPNAIDDIYHQEDIKEKSKGSLGKLLPASEDFTFFHNSSGLPRKGPDVLIKAFQNAFKINDPVRLVIKSIPSSNNQFQKLVPENDNRIVFINQGDLSRSDLIGLAANSDCYISPSRAEGFNLPVLESMRLGVPVITTAWGGHMDFCTDENAYLVDYTLVPAKTHLDNPGCFWAEPDVAELAKKMKEVYSASTTERATKTKLAMLSAREYTWEKSAKAVLEVISDLTNMRLDEKGLVLISTFNSVCGIAEYSRHLYSGVAGALKNFAVIANRDAIGRNTADPENLHRLWEYGEVDFAATLEWIKTHRQKYHAVHIQYSEGFYTLDALKKLILGIKKIGLKVILTAHGIQEAGVNILYIKDALLQVDSIHVLNTQDKAFLQENGLEKLEFYLGGNMTFPPQSKARLRKKLGIPENTFVVATHGFMVEKKGFLEVLEGVKILGKTFPNILYLAVNAVNPNNITSAAIARQFKNFIEEHKLIENVTFIPDFLSPTEIILLLSAADVSVFAYSADAKQTSSGSIALALAACRPIIATRPLQLVDTADYTYKIEDNKPETIAEAIKNFAINAQAYAGQSLKTRSHVQVNSWAKTSIKYISLLSSLLEQS